MFSDGVNIIAEIAQIARGLVEGIGRELELVQTALGGFWVSVQHWIGKFVISCGGVVSTLRIRIGVERAVFFV